MHHYIWWQARAELARQLKFVERRAANADERGGDQYDRSEPSLRRLLGKCIDEDCRADRMAGHDPPSFKSVISRRIARSIAHRPGRPRRASRVADLIPRPELSLQALDQLVVPHVVRTAPPPWTNRNCRTRVMASPFHAYVTRGRTSPSVSGCAVLETYETTSTALTRHDVPGLR